MIFLKTEEEIELMRAADQIVAITLGEMGKMIAPGVTTAQLNKRADEVIRDHGAVPNFLNYGGFPASICASINDVVVHGIPSDDQVLKDGDIISIDCGALKDGFHGDSCYTFPVGEISPEVMELCKTTKESLYKGIAQAVEGNRLGDIGNAVQSHCEAKGYGVVREMVGHGIGRAMHEDPEVPNYGRRGNGVKLKAGMCIAIEPMITLGRREIYFERDGWTTRTIDHKPAAHYEHSVAIMPSGKPADILSGFQYVEEALGDRFI